MKDTFLTVAEAAALVRCHPHTIRRWIWSRKLRAVKVGDLVRVPEQELARLVRPTDGSRKQRGRSRKGATALIATMRRLRRSVNPADVKLLEHIIAEAEQPADWTSTIA